MTGSSHEPEDEALIEKPASGLLEETSEAPRVAIEHFNPEPHREKVRQWVTLLLIGLVTIEISVVSIGLLCHLLTVDAMKEYASIVIGPTITLSGMTLGFYFASKQ